MKELILKMYFEDGKKQIEIAKCLNISKYIISRIVTKDSRYIEEKKSRKEQTKEKHLQQTKEYITKKRKENFDVIYARLKQQHIEATRELSGGKKAISNRAFRDWNTSAYRYDKTSKCYVLRNGISTGSDVPKRIKWNFY